MNWEATYNQTLALVVLTYRGIITTEELYDSSQKAIDLTHEHGTVRIMVEAKRFKTRSSREEIFRMPDELYHKWGMKRSTKIAIIRPKDLSGNSLSHFYEIASTNLGWDAKVFPDRKAALNWLHEA